MPRINIKTPKIKKPKKMKKVKGPGKVKPHMYY